MLITAIDTHQRERLQPVASLGRRDHHQCHCNSAWAVAHTHSQAELWANANLQRRGYTTFLPLMTVRRRDRVVPSMFHTVEVPLFSGYIFVKHDRTESWRPIYETPGVHSLIRTGTQLQYAPDAAVEALQATQDARRSPPAESAHWAPGMPCSLRKGYAFEGMPAVVVAALDDQVQISMMMLGCFRSITVDANCLVPRDE